MKKGTSSGSRSDCKSDSNSVASNYSFMHCEVSPSSTLERGGISLTVEWEESLKGKLTQIDIELEVGDSALNILHSATARPPLDCNSSEGKANRQSTIDSSGICVVLCPVGQGLSRVSDACSAEEEDEEEDEQGNVSGIGYRLQGIS